MSLLALPEGAVSTLYGLFDVLNAFTTMGLAEAPPFAVDIVGEDAGPMGLSGGIRVDVRRGVNTVRSSDIVIVPSMVLGPPGWTTGRYPKLVAWLRKMHAQGAVLCSACSGLFLLAETGLFDGRDATVHFVYSRAFSCTFPDVPIHPERVLVVSGEREELVTSGASTTWHDLALHLIARYAGAAAARDVARMFALQWHHDGLAPYIVFQGRSDHGDAVIAGAQQWLTKNFSVTSPVEEMVRRSHLAERTFKRRFRQATGVAPIAYVQRLRIEGAKRRLEQTEESIDQISWRVGYEDPAFFRRLFKRTTGLTPGAYRKRFRIPDFAQHPRQTF